TDETQKLAGGPAFNSTKIRKVKVLGRPERKVINSYPFRKKLSNMSIKNYVSQSPEPGLMVTSPTRENNDLKGLCRMLTR
ncbi:MAG: hypothetical protein QXK33_04905, partial [Candidatus Bathyarchaeia archaeon]